MADADMEDLPSLETLFESNIDSICPFGDIILVAKDEFLPTARFRVSSCILAMASKVFNALFSRNFAEGHRMCSREPGELLEIQVIDSPLAMRHLLRLLHHTDPLEPDEERLKSSAVLDLAIIIDKYDCTEALRLPTDALLAKFLNDDIFRLDHLSTAALMMDQPEHWRRFIKLIVLKDATLQTEHWDKKCFELLPLNLISSLAIQQIIVRQELMKQLTKFIGKFSDACEEAERQPVLQTLLAELKKLHLWPMNFDKISIKELCGKVEAIRIPLITLDPHVAKKWAAHEARYTFTIDTGRQFRTAADERAHQHSVWSEFVSRRMDAPTLRDLKYITETVQQLVVGVCLDCIQGWECRKGHRYSWADTPPQSTCYRRYEDSDGHSTWSTQYRDGERYDEFICNIDHPGHWDDAW